MRTVRCTGCDVEFSTNHSHKKFCSDPCRSRHKRREDPEKYREASRKWKAENLNRAYWARAFASEKAPKIQKAISLIERVPEHQKPRLADYLLRIGHVSLRTHRMDEFVADYNTQGI